MSSSFTYLVDQREDDPSELFEEGYFGLESSQQFDSSVAEPISETAPIHNSGGLFDCDPTSERTVRMEMPAEEGYALRQWRSENAIKLEEKEKKEKELMGQIIVEAQEFKMEFLKKTQAASETNKNTNREKEKEYLGNQEKFHSEADKNYWKSIEELIPKEVVAINTISSKKVLIQQGPKPGKPTDLSRMRQILLKLKHHTPPHFINFPSPASPASPASEAAPEVAVA